jgi:hypothetical protein
LRRPVNAVGIRCGKFWKRFLRRLPGINPELSKPEPAVSHAGATAGAEQVEGPGAGSSTACRDPLLAEATVETAAPIANVSFGLQGLGVRVVGGPCTTRWANLTVLAQSLVFLTIVALVIARTVNTLKRSRTRPLAHVPASRPFAALIGAAATLGTGVALGSPEPAAMRWLEPLMPMAITCTPPAVGGMSAASPVGVCATGGVRTGKIEDTELIGC